MWSLAIWETNFNCLFLLDGLTETQNLQSRFCNTVFFFTVICSSATTSVETNKKNTTFLSYFLMYLFACFRQCLSVNLHSTNPLRLLTEAHVASLQPLQKCGPLAKASVNRIRKPDTTQENTDATNAECQK